MKKQSKKPTPNPIIVTLYEGTLNDDELILAPQGYHFKRRGGGTVCCVYYTFQTTWTDEKHVFYAKSVEKALEKYNKIRNTALRVEDLEL